jgi:hypothetical protein
MHTCAHSTLTCVRASGRGLRTRDPVATSLPHTVQALACFTQSRATAGQQSHSPCSQKPSCASQHRPAVADARHPLWHWHRLPITPQSYRGDRHGAMGSSYTSSWPRSRVLAMDDARRACAVAGRDRRVVPRAVAAGTRVPCGACMLPPALVSRLAMCAGHGLCSCPKRRFAD